MRPSSLIIALTLALTLAMNHTAMAQIHLGTMRLFVQDLNATLVNVYDIRTETLLKSLNTGDKIIYTAFSTDQSKMFALGNHSLSIIDVNTLDIQVMKMFSEDEAYFYIEGNPNRFQKVFPLGVTESGLAVVQQSTDYMVFDALQGGRKVNTYTSESSIGCFTQGVLFMAGKDGIVKVIDPLTGTEKDRLSNVFDANAINEARKNADYNDKYVSLNLSLYGNFLISRVHLGNADKSFVQTMYDLAKREIVYTKKLAQLEVMQLLPMLGKTLHNLFQRFELLDPDAHALEAPVMPVSPDYTKMKAKDMTQALLDYQAKSQEYMVKLSEFNAKRQEMFSPKNYRAILCADVNCTQEVMRIDGTQYVSMYGDLIWVVKDTFCEIYDIRTKQLLYTIYLV